MTRLRNFKNKEVIKKILVMIFSLLVFLFLGEMISRIIFHYNMSYDIEMARYADTFKADAKNPLIGHIHKPNKTARLMGVLFHTNSDGFRDAEYTVEKNNKNRIIFLGDSFTMGWGVEESETFKNILEKSLDKRLPTEIINFGTGNYNTEQEVNLFIEKGLKYNPDEVVVFYNTNDTEVTPVKSPFSLIGSSYLLTFYNSKLRLLLGNNLNTNNYQTYYAGLYNENNSGLKRMEDAFVNLKKVTGENKIKLGVIMLPDFHNLTDYPFKKENATVASFLDAIHINNLDISPMFKDWGNAELLWVAKDDTHPNAIGHKLIAKYSENFIFENMH